MPVQRATWHRRGCPTLWEVLRGSHRRFFLTSQAVTWELRWGNCIWSYMWMCMNKIQKYATFITVSSFAGPWVGLRCFAVWRFFYNCRTCVGPWLAGRVLAATHVLPIFHVLMHETKHLQTEVWNKRGCLSTKEKLLLHLLYHHICIHFAHCPPSYHVNLSAAIVVLWKSGRSSDLINLLGCDNLTQHPTNHESLSTIIPIQTQRGTLACHSLKPNHTKTWRHNAHVSETIRHRTSNVGRDSRCCFPRPEKLELACAERWTATSRTLQVGSNQPNQPPYLAAGKTNLKRWDY